MYKKVAKQIDIEIDEFLPRMLNTDEVIKLIGESLSDVLQKINNKLKEMNDKLNLQL